MNSLLTLPQISRCPTRRRAPVALPRLPPPAALTVNLPLPYPPLLSPDHSSSPPTTADVPLSLWYSEGLLEDHEGIAIVGETTKENSIRLTRAQAKKRPATFIQAPATTNSKRKQTALAELPVSGNVQLLKLTMRLSKKEEKKKTVVVAVPVALALPPATANEAVQSDLNNPQMCPYYAKDIHLYLRSMEAEAKRWPMANFIEKVQTDVTANIRGILVDWLVEVVDEYRLVSDTLYLMISYINRFLSSNALNRQRL